MAMLASISTSPRGVQGKESQSDPLSFLSHFWSRKEQGTRVKLVAEMSFEDHLWFSLVLLLVNKLNPEPKGVVFLYSTGCAVYFIPDKNSGLPLMPYQ